MHVHHISARSHHKFVSSKGVVVLQEQVAVVSMCLTPPSSQRDELDDISSL